MAYSHRRTVSCLFFLALWLTPQSQVLAVQSAATVLPAESLERQPSSTDLVFNHEGNSRNRLQWTLIGGATGAVLGLLVRETYPFADGDQGSYALGGAVLGAIAGLILSGPSPSESSELRLGTAVRAYIPARGGIGLALDL